MKDLREISEEQLFELYRDSRDIDVRNELLERYLYLAKIIAKKFTGRGIEYEDLLQTASLALVRAIERFDPEKGIKFNSFATPSLIGEVKNYFRDTARIIRMPRADGALIKKLNDVIAGYQSARGETPGPAEIAREMGIKEEKVLELLDMRNAGNVLSLDAAIDDEGDANIMSTLGEDESGFHHIENRDFLKYCLSVLNEDERKIIINRYVNKKTQSEVAKMLGVSQMQVSRLEKKILSKLKTKLA